MRLTKYFYLILLVLMTASLEPINGQGLNPDSLALVALYKSTKGDAWKNNRNWLVPGQSISTWYGVTAKNGQVRKLRLVNNNLNGVLPPELGNLTAMTDLIIYNNKYLRGEIPARLGNARSLVILDLHWNGLSGKVPDELSKLTKLRKLYLYSNKREGISPGFSGTLPPSLDDLPTLYTINIRNNSFSTVPTYSRAPVSTLYMDYNLLTELPDISAFSRMLHLQVQGNQLDFADLLPLVPNSYRIFNYGSQADVGEPYIMPVAPGNTIQISCPQNSDGIVVQWFKDGVPVPGQQQDLYIKVATAADAGSYVCEITHPDLPQLILKSTPVIVHVELTPGQSDSLALVALYDATDGDNWLNNDGWKSATPYSDWYGIDEVDAQGRVKKISLGGNNISGNLPSAIANLELLESIYLSYNEITGLPSELGGLSNLKSLYIGGNPFNQFPIEVITLENLRDLDLSFLDLSNLPATISQLDQLEYIGLRYNSMEQFPEVLLDMYSLHSIDLAGNQLSTLPASIQQLSQLERLTLSNNRFSTFPENILLLANSLKGLDIGFNNIGSLTANIGQLQSLEILNAWNCGLNNVPASLSNLTDLKTLRLSFNNLRSVPTAITTMTGIRFLYLDHNQIRTVPRSIASITGLRELDLSYNEISNFDVDIRLLTDLSSLYLHGNTLRQLHDRFAETTADYVTLSYNCLAFGALEPIVAAQNIDNLNYAPQNEITWSPSEVHEGDYFAFYPAVSYYGGENGQFAWYNPQGVLISETSWFSVSNFSQADVGEYYCEITNTVATDLTLHCTISLSMIPADGAKPMAVVINAEEVNEVRTSDEKTTLPGDPTFPLLPTGHAALAGSPLVSNQSLAAALATGNHTLFTGRVPERQRQEPMTLLLTQGQGEVINSGITDPAYQYQWYKDGEPLAGAQQPQLRIAAHNEQAAGEYYCEFLLPKASDLAGRTEILAVEVVEAEAIVLGPDLGEFGVPEAYELQQNYPNPFNPTTTIRYALPQAANVELRVYNIAGQLVRTLVNNYANAGYHEAVWDGQNAFGQQVASGVYIYELRAGSFRSHKKMLLVK
jgi:Leucine-rich repeat (LRR) protein